jgi:hypothetical protein
MAGRHVRTALTRRPAVAVSILTVLLRLTFLAVPVAPDEGGYLAVAAQWSPAGTSLYGQYWVDRPPLLITIFQAASLLGGITALRLLGALAAALTVMGVASAVSHVGSARAATWSAVVTGALLASPLLGTVEVNGELLASPFVAWGISLAVTAVGSGRGRRAALAAAGSGACAIGALLVKQNMADVLVFAVVTWVVALRNADVARTRFRVLVATSAGGAGLMLGLVSVWTVAHGTSMTGVYDAIYPFRVAAARVIATHTGAADTSRLLALVAALVISGVPVLMLAFAWKVLRRRIPGAVAWGLFATMCWAAASTVLGGGFWNHYLVEMVVPAAMGAGLLVAAQPAMTRRIATGVVLVAAVSWAVGLVLPTQAPGQAIGASLASSSRPGDTLVSAFGDAETVQSSGLASPYPYLWTLPAQTLDPRLSLLEGMLAGSKAPTWFVDWGRPSFTSAQTARLAALVHAHYRAVAVVCGHPVYLHDGVSRRTPRPGERCVEPSAAAPILRSVL